jgi:hypothetical protein
VGPVKRRRGGDGLGWRSTSMTIYTYRTQIVIDVAPRDRFARAAAALH